MTLVEFPNKLGTTLIPFNHYPSIPSSTAATTVNAVGESAAFVGQIYLTSGLGTSKTISSGGGKVWFLPGSVTWATAGTTLRVGIQDIVAGTGVEDGIYDVFDDLVQGTDTITSSIIKEVIMSSGTKTITHGDLIAVVIEMTVRNGVDSVIINRASEAGNFPYTTVDTGGGPGKLPTAPLCVIKFDDGTIGYFGDWMIPFTETTLSFSSSSTPDEYAVIFSFPFKCTINAFIARLGEVDAGETATMHLIEDPLGAITNLVTATLDPILQAQIAVGAVITVVEITETTLKAGTTYAVSYRPTSTGVRNIRLIGLLDVNFRLATVGQFLGANRTDLGAFSTSGTSIPDIGIRINKIDDGTGSSGGATSFAYMG